MQVKLVKDYGFIPSGTVLQNAVLRGYSWEGLFASSEGSYIVSVPASYCYEYLDSAKQENEKCLQRFINNRRTNSTLGYIL